MDKATKKPSRPCLHPPSHGHPPDESAPAPSWVILDLHAFIADRVNATTASCRMSNGDRIRATFCVAPPPLVSYACVWYPDLPPAEVAAGGMHATVDAAGADLILLRSTLRGGGLSRRDDLVYQAGSGDGKGSSQSLHLLQADSVDFIRRSYSTGLLAHRDVVGPHAGDDGGGGDRFYVASLGRPPADTPGQDVDFGLFDSMDDAGSRRPLDMAKWRRHHTFKVVALGGGGRLLGFADLWRGILVCDVLSLSEDHVVYIMDEPARLFEEKGLVLSVDMRKKRVRGVAVFDAQRMLAEAYMQSRISKYFNRDLD